MRETDLRVVKTRANIRRCFLELLQEKTLNKISLQELCKRAQCSRNTFYMHYQYIDTLYEQLVDECIVSITDSLRPLVESASEMSEEIIDQYAVNFLDGIAVNADMLCILIGGDCNGTFAKTLTDALYHALVNYGAQISGKYADSDEWRLVCRYSAGGFAGFAIFWLQNRSVPIERAKEILRDLIASPMHIGKKILPNA